MPTFIFDAVNPNGKTVKGRLDAPNEVSLVNRLSQEGYVILSVQAVKTKKKGVRLRAKLGDLVLFTRQFSTMINAGVRIKDALQILSRQEAFTKPFRKVLENILVSIDGGMSLAEAFDEAGIFDPVLVNLMQAGESGGVLDEALLKLSKFYEDSKRIKDQIRSAMAYPLFVSIFAILILMVISLFILPNLFRAFGNVKPTGVVALLMNGNDYMVHHWLSVIIFLIVSTVGGYYFMRTPYGVATKAFVLSLFPPIKKLRKLETASSFSKTLATLISSGVSIMDAVKMAANSTSDHALIKTVPQMVDTLRNGGTLKEAMQKSKYFPQLLVEMVGTGEETGRVDEMLNKVADFYDEEVSVKLKQIVSMVEPAMIGFIGIAVGFLTYSLYQTMFSLENGAGQFGK
ncbi:type II secretion system F family protein [Mesoaciditoga sp.]